ncbi:MAG: hypothetical protein Q9174_001253 [Haloplaca sp. 1 TL-2023]
MKYSTRSITKIQPSDVEMVVAAALHFKEVTADEVADVLNQVLDQDMSDLDVYRFINHLKFYPPKPPPGHQGPAYFDRWEAFLPYPTNEDDQEKLANIELRFNELLDQAYEVHGKKMQDNLGYRKRMRKHVRKERELVGDLPLKNLACGRTLVEQMQLVGIFKASMTHVEDRPSLAMLRRVLRLDGDFIPNSHALRGYYVEDSTGEEALDGRNVEGWINALPGTSPAGTKGETKGKDKATEDTKLESDGKGKELVKVGKKGKGKEVAKMDKTTGT